VESNGNTTSTIAKEQSLPSSKHSTKTIRTQTKQAKNKIKITKSARSFLQSLDDRISLEQKSTCDLFSLATSGKVLHEPKQYLLPTQGYHEAKFPATTAHKEKNSPCINSYPLRIVASPDKFER